MKVTMSFNLPEDREEFETALKGIDYKIALDDIDNYFRSKIKYVELSEEVAKAFVEAREYLYKTKVERGIYE